MKLRTFTALFPGIMASPLAAEDHKMEILIPAYFDSAALWGKLAEAQLKAPVTAIMNPDSGPGEESQKDNYLPLIRALTKAGGRVVGYVYTITTGTTNLRPLAAVKDDIDKYVAWYGPTGPDGEKGLEGIFVDQMKNYPGDADGTRVFYQAVYDYVMSKGPRFRVIGNPGTTYGTIEKYLTPPAAAHTLVTFENLSGYEEHITPDWLVNHPVESYAHIHYNIASAATMESYIRIAQSRNARYVYVTDDYMTGSLVNPWDLLPTYWDPEVAFIKSLNDAAVSTRTTVEKTPGQAATVRVSGSPGLYGVQVSDDLTVWETPRVIVSATGAFSWTDQASIPKQKRFYRTVPQE